MKTIILFTIFILPSLGGVGGGFYAQTVTIPDPNFKARLIIAEVDTNHDGEIQVSEAEAVTGMLDVSIFHPDYPIYDLTGIEAFVNITGLDVKGNQLTTLDLSNNLLLIELNCISNNLSYLNLENCINLEILKAYHNQLTSIDLTPNIHLKQVPLYDNQLTHIDIRNGNNIDIEYFHSGDNPNLICIFVDDAEYSENAPYWYKDPASSYVETQAECDALGIEDINSSSIKIYPNPAEEILNINIPGNDKNIEIRIVNSKGAMYLINQFNSNSIQLDIHCLKSGIYFIILENQQTKETLIKKLIKL